MRSRAPHPRVRIFGLIAGAFLSIAAAVAVFYWGTCARATEPYLQSKQDSTGVKAAVAAAPTPATTTQPR